MGNIPFSKKKKKVDKLWNDIQEITGPAEKWPGWIKTLFWTKNLRHHQRPLICAFVVYNGLNLEVLITFYDISLYLKINKKNFFIVFTL